MFTIKLAQHAFQIDNSYPYVENFCRDYQIPADSAAPVIRITPRELAAENQDGGRWSEGYLESLAVYRKICKSLVQENIILFHSSALALDGKAVLFIGPSGTGKSTHARLWRQRFGDRIVTVNDDKPLVAFSDREIRVYGTPYGGKDNLQTNTSAPVIGIVALRQAEKNTIRRLTPREALPKLLNQTYRPEEPADLLHTLDLVRKMSDLPVWELGCTISQEAVDLSCGAIFERNG